MAATVVSKARLQKTKTVLETQTELDSLRRQLEGSEAQAREVAEAMEELQREAANDKQKLAIYEGNPSELTRSGLCRQWE